MAINKRTKLNREGMKAVFVSTDDARNPAFFRGKAVSDGDFDAAIAVVDQDKIIDETDAQFTVDIWDRESKINGRSPADVVKATGLPSGCLRSSSGEMAKSPRSKRSIPELAGTGT